MILCVTPDDLAQRAGPENSARMVQMFGDRLVPWDGPCGHLVHQIPEDNNGAHFHEGDQYQIFIAGEARVGGHAVRRGSIHYADGYAGYGPIVTDAGCSYYTLRAAHDVSRHLLPQDAALTRGRSAHQKVGDMLDPDPGAAPRTLFARPDGVGACQVDAGPGEALAQVPAEGGCYWIIMAGTAEIDGCECPRGSCLWVGEGEARPEMTAGLDGATAVVLKFARAQSQAARGARTWTG